MTDDPKLSIISQALDDLLGEVVALRQDLTALNEKLDRLEYRIGQHGRAMDRMAQYTAGMG